MRASREAYPAKPCTAGTMEHLTDMDALALVTGINVACARAEYLRSLFPLPPGRIERATHGEGLAPCPFCGGSDIDPHYMTDGEIAPIHGDGAMPGCRSCGATAPNREVWNHRTYSTPMHQQRLEEDAMKSAEAEGRAGRAIDRADHAEKLLWNVDAVARYRGDEYGVPDSIDDNGAAYQSQDLLTLLDEVDRRRSGVVAAHRLNRAAPFDFRAHLERQRDWSANTFGPGVRTKGITDHIRKELIEIESAPHDIEEWIDVVILALDGAWRAGAYPDQIISVLAGKQAKNEKREWPDWRTQPENKAIEHDRRADHATRDVTDEDLREGHVPDPATREA